MIQQSNVICNLNDQMSQKMSYIIYKTFAHVVGSGYGDVNKSPQQLCRIIAQYF